MEKEALKILIGLHRMVNKIDRKNKQAVTAVSINFRTVCRFGSSLS